MTAALFPGHPEVAPQGRKGRTLVDSGASFGDETPEPLYRYLLWREYEKCAHRAQTMLFVMLNPSTANAVEDDATIRRVCDYALRHDCSRIEVVNLFAFRSTDPKNLATVSDPVGPLNDRNIEFAARNATWVVCAWGASAPKGVDFDARRRDVVELLRDARRGGHLFCLGTCANGEPKHPVRLPSNTTLEVYKA